MPHPPGLDTRGLDPVVGFLLALADVPLKRVFQRAIGTPLALRPVEFSLLVLLQDNPGAAPKALAAALNLSPPNLTVLVDRLAARGLVERRRSASDGRAQELLLTASGTALARQAQRAAQAMEVPALAPLSPGEQALLRELLVKLARGAPPPAAAASPPARRGPRTARS